MPDDEGKDEEEQQPQGWIPMIQVGGPTPAQVKEATERRLMQQHSLMAEISNAFDSMNEDQLSAFRRIFGWLMGAGPQEAYAMSHYYAGMLEELLRTKFGLCLLCGKHHDDELKAMVHGEGNPDGEEGAS